MLRNSEDKIQADCFQWLWNNHPRTRKLFFSVPLGGLRTASEASRLQATGAVPGIPDTILCIAGAYQGKKYSIAFVEFKTPDGKVSSVQAAVHKTLETAGHLVVVIRSLTDFKKFIQEYLKSTEYLIP
jgi:hypothetical protein